MKKLFITLALAAATFVGANAQFIIGGQLGVDYSSDVNALGVKDDKTSNFGFEIAPIVGYNISDKWLVGAKLGFGIDKTKYEPAIGPTTEGTTTSWTIAPFARYNFAKVGDFTFGAQAMINVGGEYLEDVYSDFNFGINIYPVVNYAFNDHWSMEGIFGFASIGYNMTSRNHDAAGAEDETFHNFGLGINKSQAVAIAAVYTF